jgi:WD40 repeat protein
MIRDEPRSDHPRTVALAATLALLAAPLACRPDPAPPAASAEPLGAASSPAPLAASASAAASGPSAAMTHQPGTVPPLPTSRPAAVRPDAGPPAPPTFTRLPAAKSRRAGAPYYTTSFTGKGALLAISSPAGVDFVDATTGAGFSITAASLETFDFSPDQSLLALSESGTRVTLWDVAAGALRHTWPGGAASVLFSADGKRVALAGEGFVAVRDAGTGAEIMRAIPDSNPFGLAFSTSGKELVVTGNNVLVWAYAVDSGAKLPGGGGADTTGTFGIALSPDGRWAAASAPAGHGLQVFDVHAWGPRTLVVLPEGSCKEHIGPSFPANGRFVFAHGGQRWVKGFETGTWKPYASYHAPEGREIASVAADLSRVVVTKGEGRGAAVVTVGNGAETKLERAFEAEAGYSISADGLHVAGSAGGAVRVWSAKTGRVVYEQQP